MRARHYTKTRPEGNASARYGRGALVDHDVVCNLSGDQIVQAPPPKACSSRSSSSGITRALLVVEVTQEVAAELEMGRRGSARARRGSNNRTHMVRIPDPGRLEFRLMDGAANPYLMPAGLLAAGLDGIAAKRDPGRRLDINMYTDGARLRGIRKLPLKLLDAIRATRKSRILRTALGDEVIDSYTKLKLRQWDGYSAAIFPWEREQTLDC